MVQLAIMEVCTFGVLFGLASIHTPYTHP